MSDTISSWNIPGCRNLWLAAHPKCPALGACLAHAWDTMILSQIQKYPAMKIENWRNLIEPGNVMYLVVNIW